jgi:hypothetical protein
MKKKSTKVATATHKMVDPNDPFRYGYKQQPHSGGQSFDQNGEVHTMPGMAPTIQELIEASNRGTAVRIDQRLSYPEHEDDHLYDPTDLSDLDLMKLQIEEINAKKSDAGASSSDGETQETEVSANKQTSAAESSQEPQTDSN